LYNTSLVGVLKYKPTRVTLVFFWDVVQRHEVTLFKDLMSTFRAFTAVRSNPESVVSRSVLQDTAKQSRVSVLYYITLRTCDCVTLISYDARVTVTLPFVQSTVQLSRSVIQTVAGDTFPRHRVQELVEKEVVYTPVTGSRFVPGLSLNTVTLSGYRIASKAPTDRALRVTVTRFTSFS